MFRFTRHGFREMLIGTLVLIVIAVGLGWAWWPLALITLPVLIWLFAFFRDPERVVPTDQHVMVSPADGKVSDITELDSYEPLGNVPCVRVGIFLSVFNVHVNRSPCEARLVDIIDKRGKFINAMSHDQASEQNQSKTIILAEPTSDRRVAVVKLIVGMIARRIVFTCDRGEVLRRGQRIGMIKFGSRTELYIPKSLQPQIKVSVGDTVRGAADVIAVLGQPIHGQTKKLDDEEFEPLVGRESPA
jgi:phosphatidylserine decarboxylase